MIGAGLTPGYRVAVVPDEPTATWAVTVKTWGALAAMLDPMKPFTCQAIP